jgi:hypothetical protein
MLFLLLLATCAASELGLTLEGFGNGECTDAKGRRGAMQVYDHCNGQSLCLAYIARRCVVPDLPPRLAGGLWECDEHYQLAGSRISWPGGAFAVEPEKCSPV